MSINKEKLSPSGRKKSRVRYNISRTSKGRLRITVFRSLNNIYVQIIDDAAHNTLASCSSLEMKNVHGSKKDIAFAVGQELAKRIIAIAAIHKDNVVFDRGPYMYHGRVAKIADGLRAGGLNF